MRLIPLTPLYGTGARYGESVSSSILSIGHNFSVSESPEFLNVTTPFIPTQKFFNFIISSSSSKFPPKAVKYTSQRFCAYSFNTFYNFFCGIPKMY